MTWSFLAQSTLARARPQSGEGPADQMVRLGSPLLANSQFHPKNEFFLVPLRFHPQSHKQRVGTPQ